MKAVGRHPPPTAFFVLEAPPVIPAKAGIHAFDAWDRRFRGNRNSGSDLARRKRLFRDNRGPTIASVDACRDRQGKQAMKLTSIILAAGQGTRMRSRLPKVLHPIAGRPMLGHVIAAAQALRSEAIHVVYGHGGETVKQVLAGEEVRWVEQAEQLGTGHAVEQAMPEVPDDHTVLVLYGDVPLITGETLSRVAEAAGNGEAVAVLTVELDDPTGYGRIVRSERGDVQRIVEQKDASPEELAIREINTGLAGRARPGA